MISKIVIKTMIGKIVIRMKGVNKVIESLEKMIRKTITTRISMAMMEFINPAMKIIMMIKIRKIMITVFKIVRILLFLDYNDRNDKIKQKHQSHKT